MLVKRATGVKVDGSHKIFIRYTGLWGFADACDKLLWDKMTLKSVLETFHWSRLPNKSVKGLQLIFSHAYTTVNSLI